MSGENLDDFFEAAKEAAQSVGGIIRRAFAQEKSVSTKIGFADLVTETDKKVEGLIIGQLRNKFPTHSFIGEESTVEGVHCILTDNPTWIIDPIDGTTNFVHRFPYVAVSIGLVINKQAEVGVVYNPILEEMYTARPGKGAYCNGQKLQATSTIDLGKALVCAEFGSSRDPDQLDSKLYSMRKVLEQVHGIRSLGCATMNMCMVAAGRADGYWEFGLHAWDIAAADLIVREAGGTVSSTDGNSLDLFGRRVLCAGTKELATQISKLIKQMNLDRD